MPLIRVAGFGLPVVAGNIVCPSKNVIVPVGVPGELDWTTAVKVIEAPTAAVMLELETVVTVSGKVNTVTLSVNVIVS